MLKKLPRSLVVLMSVTFIGAIIGKEFRYSMNFFIGSGFGADVLGFFTFGIVLIRAGSVLVSLGLRTSSQRIISKYEQNGDTKGLVGATIVFVPAISGLVFATVMYLSWPYLVDLFGVNINQNVRIFFFGIPLFALMNILSTATRGFKETKFYVYIRDIGRSGIAAALIAIVTYVFGNSAAIIYAYIVSLLVGTGLALWYLYKLGAFDMKIQPRIDFF